MHRDLGNNKTIHVLTCLHVVTLQTDEYPQNKNDV